MEEIVEELIVDPSATDYGGTRGSLQRVQGAAVYGGIFGELAVGWGFVHFLRSSRSSGVERQFFEPSSTPMSARGLLPICSQLLSGSFMCGQTHMLTSSPKQQQQHSPEG